MSGRPVVERFSQSPGESRRAHGRIQPMYRPRRSDWDRFCIRVAILAFLIFAIPMAVALAQGRIG